MQISDLASYGFNVAEAMELCIDDEEIYREVLETFLEEGKEKFVLFAELIDKGDMQRYIIEAHGLKNAAKQVGATELSEQAKDSELSGKAGDFERVKSIHASLLANYKKILEIIEQLF